MSCKDLIDAVDYFFLNHIAENWNKTPRGERDIEYDKYLVQLRADFDYRKDEYLKLCQNILIDRSKSFDVFTSESAEKVVGAITFYEDILHKPPTIKEISQSTNLPVEVVEDIINTNNDLHVAIPKTKSPNIYRNYTSLGSKGQVQRAIDAWEPPSGCLNDEDCYRDDLSKTLTNAGIKNKPEKAGPYGTIDIDASGIGIEIKYCSGTSYRSELDRLVGQTMKYQHQYKDNLIDVIIANEDCPERLLNIALDSLKRVNAEYTVKNIS